MRVKLYRGAFYAVWTENGRTRRIALRTKDHGEAEKRLRELKREIAGPRRTVGEIFAAYLEEKRALARNPARIEVAWKALKPTFGGLEPRDVDRTRCRAYAENRMAAGRSATTARKELAYLRAALRWHDPLTPARFAFPPPAPPRDRYLTRREYDRLLKAAQPVFHLEVFITLALATAARTEALLSLKWADVDLSRGLVTFSSVPGGKRRATVPLNTRARAVLKRAREAARTPYVIEWADRGLKTVRQSFAKACERAGLRGVTPHVLRHTAAVWMAEAEAPMSEISQYLGHSSTRVTEAIYARYSPGYLRRAAAALE